LYFNWSCFWSLRWFTSCFCCSFAYIAVIVVEAAPGSSVVVGSALAVAALATIDLAAAAALASASLMALLLLLQSLLPLMLMLMSFLLLEGCQAFEVSLKLKN
jgi:hypothetical protein